MTLNSVVIHGVEWDWDDIKDVILDNRKISWNHKKYEIVDDHEHCDICWHTISLNPTPSDGEGYIDEYNNWLCIECFEQFIKCV